MKISAFLNAAKKCTTPADVATLELMVREAFMATKALRYLTPANNESDLEAPGGAYLHFEANRVISDEYITMIRPEIRDGKFVIAVVTNRMLDKHGLASKSWDQLEDMDDLIEAEPEQSVYELAQAAKDKAIDHHMRLIESVGVPRVFAGKAAQRSW